MTKSQVPNPSQHEARALQTRSTFARCDTWLAGDILRWVISEVGKFPKNVRYGLGARLESAHFDVLEELIRAQYARGGGRGRALELANTRLQIARHLARMADVIRGVA